MICIELSKSLDSFSRILKVTIRFQYDQLIFNEFQKKF